MSTFNPQTNFYKQNISNPVGTDFIGALFSYCEEVPIVDPEFTDAKGSVLTFEQLEEISLHKHQAVVRAREELARKRRSRSRERALNRRMRLESYASEVEEAVQKFHAKRSRTVKTKREEARLVRMAQHRHIVHKRAKQHERRVVSAQGMLEDIDICMKQSIHNVGSKTKGFSLDVVNRIKAFMSRVKQQIMKLLTSIGKALFFDKIVEYVDKLVNLFGYVYTLLNTDDMITVISITKLFVSSMGFSKLSEYSVAMVTGLCHKFARSLIESKTKKEDVQVFDSVVNSQALSDDISMFASDFTGMLNLPTIRAFINLLLVCAKNEWLPKHVAFKLYDFFGHPTKMTGLELISYSLHAIAKIVKAGEMLAAGATFSEVLFAEDPYEALLKEAKYLVMMKGRTYSGLPIEDYLSEVEYDMRVRVALANIANFKIKLNSRDNQYKVLEEQNLALLQIKMDLVSRSKGRSRVAPKAYVIHGASSIGKSHILKLLCKLFCDVMRIPYSASLMYQKNAEEFWTGYEPLSQPFVQYPEVGSMHRNIAAKGLDALTSQLLSLIDSNPFNCPMADVASKGFTYAQPKGVFIDTNVPDMNFGVLFNNPAAFDRRFDFIEVVVDPECCLPGSQSIDPTKCLDRRFLDKYTFRVYRKIPIDSKCVISKPVDIFKGRIDAFCDFIRDSVVKHFTAQERDTDISGLYGYGKFSEIPQPQVNKEGIKKLCKVKSLKERSIDAIDYVGMKAATLYGKLFMDPIEEEVETLPDPDCMHVELDEYKAEKWKCVGCQFEQTLEDNPVCQKCRQYDCFDARKCPTCPRYSFFPDSDKSCGVCVFENRHKPKDIEMKSMSGLNIESTNPYFATTEPEIDLGFNVDDDDEKSDFEIRSNSDRIRDIERQDHLSDIDLTSEVFDAQCRKCSWFSSSHKDEYMCAPGVPLGDLHWVIIDGVKKPNPKYYRLEKDVYVPTHVFNSASRSMIAVPGEVQKDKSDSLKAISINTDITVSSLEVSIYKFLMRYEARSIYHTFMVVLALLGISIGFDRVILAIIVVHLAYTNYALIFKNFVKNQLCVALDKKEKAVHRMKVFLGKNVSWVAPTLAILSVIATTSIVLNSYTVKRAKKDDRERRRRSKPQVEKPIAVDAQMTEFKDDDECNLELNKLEELVGARKPDKRIVVKTLPDCWNVRTASLRCVFTQDVFTLYNCLYAKQVLYRYVGVKTNRTRGVLIDNNIALVLGHPIFFRDDGTFELQISPTGNFENDRAVKRTIIHRDRLELVRSDIYVAQVSQENVKPLVDFFAPDDVFQDITEGIFDGEKVTLKYQKKFNSIINAFNSDETRYPKIKHPQEDYYINYIPVEDVFTYETTKAIDGMCGTLVLAQKDKGSCIVGVHIFGTPSMGGAIPVTAAMLKDAIKRLKDKSDLLVLSAHSYEDTLPDLEGEIHPKSLLNYMPVHGVEYLGTLKEIGSTHEKSQVTRTKFDKADIDELLFDEFGFVASVEYGPPLMKEKFHPEYVNPINKNMEKIAAEKKPVCMKRVKRCVESYFKHITSFYQDDKYRTLSPWDIDVAIDGFVEDGYIKKLDMKKSAGFGNKGKKGDYFIEYNTPDGIKHEPVSKLKKRIRKYLDKLVRGVAPGAVFQTKLKDEPRDVNKIAQGKTRLFCISEMVYLICARMFLGPLYTMIMENNEAFRTALGVDMHRGGVNIFKDIKSFSPFNMEGDYSNYDQSMPFEIGWGVATLMHKLAKFFGYNDSALEAVRALMTDSLFPILVVNGDVFRAAGFQPSGFYDTISNNSMRGVLLKLYYFDVMTGDPDNYFIHTRGRVAGDDTADGVDAEMKDVYNGIQYQKGCKDLFGMPFTPTEKDGDMTEFVEPKDLSFLKRKERSNLMLKRETCALDMNSIRKTFTWHVPSGIIDDFNQMIQATQGNMVELFIYSESFEQYERIRQKVVDMICRTYDKKRDDILPLFKTGKRMVASLNNQQPDPEDIPEREMPYIVVNAQSLEEFGETQWPEQSVYDCCRPFEGGRRDARIKNSFFTIITMMCVALLVILGECCGNARTLNEIVHQQESIDMCRSMEDFLWRAQPRGVTSAMESICFMRSQLLDKLDSMIEVEPPLQGISLTQMKLHPSYGSDPHFTECVNCYFQYASTKESIIETIKVLDSYIALRRTFVFDAQAEWEANITSVMTEQKLSENVTDVSGDIPNVSSIPQSENFSTVPKEIWSNDEFFKRPIYIGSTIWTVGQKLSYVIDPWDLYMTNPAVRSKLRNQWLMSHANLHLRVVVSGTPFHQGRLLHGYLPYQFGAPWLYRYISAGDTAEFTRLVAFSQLAGTVYIDPSDNKPSEIVAPLIKTQPSLRFNGSLDGTVIASGTQFTDFQIQGKMFLFSFDVLEAVTDSPTNVSINVYAWMSEVDVGVDTGTRLVVDSQSMEEKVGPMQTVCMSAAEISKALAKAPIIGPYAQAGEMLFGGLGKLAAVYGFSRPTLVSEPTRMKNEPFQNAANVIGSETTNKISLDPQAQLSVSNTVTDDQVDQMHFGFISNKESFISRVDWTTTDAVMTPFYSFAVTPCHLPSENLVGIDGMTNFQPTPAGWLTTFFNNWRCDRCIYRFDVIKTKFHRGKWAILYEPNAVQSTLISGGIANLNLEHVAIVDLQEVTSFEIEIGWNQRSYYQQTLYNSVGLAANSTSGFAPDYSVVDNASNGYFIMFPITKLQAPMTKSIHINVFSRFPGMELNGLTSFTFNNQNPYNYMGWTIPPSVVVDSQASEEKQMTITLNGVSESPSVMNLDVYGEKPTSWRQLLKRYQSEASTALVTEGIGTVQDVMVEAMMNIIPLPKLDITATSVADINGSMFARVRMAYLGMRGSHKWRMSVASNLTDVRQGDQILVGLIEPEESTYDNDINYYDLYEQWWEMPINGFNQYVPYTQSGIEYHIPHYTNNRFALAQTYDPYDYLSNEFFDYRAFRRYRVWWPQYGVPNNRTIGLNFMHAIGDDFSFMHFLAAPCFSQPTVGQQATKKNIVKPKGITTLAQSSEKYKSVRTNDDYKSEKEYKIVW